MQQAQTDWFETWFGSPYYKILYANRDELEAQAFARNIIDYLQPLKNSAMLDIACGEGRFAKQLADYGFDVTGIDLSNQNIETARLSEHERLHFYVHDMRFPFYINYFDYAFNFFTSFGYFTRQRDHLMAAKSFSSALKKGGLLVIDYLNREYAVNSLIPHEVVEKGRYVFDVKRKLDENHFIKEITLTGTDTGVKHFSETVAAFTLADFIHLFKEAGLALVSTFGDYQLGSYHPLDSPRMIMIFKK